MGQLMPRVELLQAARAFWGSDAVALLAAGVYLNAETVHVMKLNDQVGYCHWVSNLLLDARNLMQVLNTILFPVFSN